jgi:hypothetical protein
MTTTKFHARSGSSNHWRKFPLMDDEGFLYEPVRSSAAVAIGDAAYLGKRVNNHHGEVPLWELWPIIIEKDPLYTTPKLWYGFNRYVFLRVGRKW